MGKVLYCPFIATLGYTGPPDCSLPSCQADHRLSFASHLTGRGAISDSQGTPPDTEHDAGEEKEAQVKRRKTGSPTKVTPHSMYKGLGGGIFSPIFHVCVRVLACTCAHACAFAPVWVHVPKFEVNNHAQLVFHFIRWSRLS